MRRPPLSIGPIHLKRLLAAGTLAALIFAIAMLHASSAGAAPQQQAVSGPAAAAPSGDYMGSDVCATCHSDIAKNFGRTAHTRLALEHKGQGVTCESCHGPGKAHVESGGDISKIIRFKNASADKIDDTCLTCHAAAHPNFLRSSHGQAGVSCLSCHSVHHATTSSFLLTAAQPALCYACHADQKVRFTLPFHHRVNEGLMKCTDCHNPHGTFQQKQLRSAADQDLICTKCHTETAGPFVYEHPAVRAEGCMTCHSPHGSPNPRLLKVSNINTLCMQCHSASSLFTPPGTPSFHNQATQYVSCTSCHTQIHGSNADEFFFK